MDSTADHDLNHNSFAEQFRALQNEFHLNPCPSICDRILGLKRLRSSLVKYRKEVTTALCNDFAKPIFETETSEILVCLREIDFVIKNIQFWSQNKIVKTDILLFGTHSYVRYEPRGVVLIISPWNYPVNLSLYPLIAAYAAGNKIVLKPSELAVHSAIIIEKIVEESFSKTEVLVVQGDASKSAELVRLPFNFIFFTGSGSVAKKILAQAAKNLTPCTLELGGKCPAILDKDVDIASAVEQITFSKLLNAGQTCIAPDFIVVHHSNLAEFIDEWNINLVKKYGKNILGNEEYCGIVNQIHYTRILKLISDGIEQGHVISSPIEFDALYRKIKPVLFTLVNWNDPIMEEEIFGPVLPVICYSDIEEVLIQLRHFDRPLNLYIFSKTPKFYEQVIANTRSGGITINQCILNYTEYHLPFGGDHHSGTGSYHGQYGFYEFSHKRSITKQSSLPSTLKLFYPPYSKFKQKVKNILIKFYS